MCSSIRIAKAFANALDAEDYQVAQALLAGDCVYQCRGKILNGPDEIITSYQGHGEKAESIFDAILYENNVTKKEDGIILIEFYDHFSLNDKKFTLKSHQEISVGDDLLIHQIEHKDIPGLLDQLSNFIRENQVN